MIDLLEEAHRRGLGGSPNIVAATHRALDAEQKRLSRLELTLRWCRSERRLRQKLKLLLWGIRWHFSGALVSLRAKMLARKYPRLMEEPRVHPGDCPQYCSRYTREHIKQIVAAE